MGSALAGVVSLINHSRIFSIMRQKELKNPGGPPLDTLLLGLAAQHDVQQAEIIESLPGIGVVVAYVRESLSPMVLGCEAAVRAWQIANGISTDPDPRIRTVNAN